MTCCIFPLMWSKHSAILCKHIFKKTALRWLMTSDVLPTIQQMLLNTMCNFLCVIYRSSQFRIYVLLEPLCACIKKKYQVLFHVPKDFHSLVWVLWHVVMHRKCQFGCMKWRSCVFALWTWALKYIMSTCHIWDKCSYLREWQRCIYCIMEGGANARTIYDIHYC